MGNVIANTVVKVITNKIQKSDEKLYKCKQDVVGVKEENDIFYNKSFPLTFILLKIKVNFIKYIL